MTTAWRRLRFKLLVNLYPPYPGAGIRVQRIANDFSTVEVRMALHFWNRNYVGTHFGRSLYSMTDPFLMLMLIEMLGPGYVVWDRSASIRSEPIRDAGRGATGSGIFVPDRGLE